VDIIPSSHEHVNPIRDWLAGRMRRDSVPDWLWQELERDGVTGLPKVDLFREARRRLRAIRSDEVADPESGSTEVNVDDLLDPAESDRAWAFSEYIAGLAAANPDLQEFRSTHLDGRVLSRDESNQFMASEPLLYLSATTLRSKGIPLWGHTVVKCDRRTGSVSYPRKSGPPSLLFRRDVHAEISWGGKTEVFDPWTESSPGADPFPKIELPTGGRWFPHEVWSGSVYDELRKVTERLVKQYPWNGPEATTYVLTGDVPFIPPIYVAPVEFRVGAFGQTKLEVTIEPWVSARTVARFYKYLRSASFTGRSRALGEKNLALFRFVTRHTQPGHEIPSYEELRKMWNSQYPKWQYQSAWVLARDYRRAGKVIVFPRYQIGARANRGRGPESQQGGGE
jgi:hypothetical protein